ncbi:hypothetical protein ACFXP3_01275 [Streptomyces sp. NPDC059096]|uniref:hypothetical protein n=1 Tax=Streptomyces sp. NPDC059096 TaxID=3346727 RepID=UPI0036738652
MFVGSTGDRHTFLILNRHINGAHRLLTEAGFTARAHHGRTVYLLPPGTADDAIERAGAAARQLLAHTTDCVDLANTTRYSAAGPLPEPDVRLQFTDGAVTATAGGIRAGVVLALHGFTPAAAGTRCTLEPGLDERDAVNTVVGAEAHLRSEDFDVSIDLGIATPEAIPPAPGRTATAAPNTPAPQRSRLRTR